MIFAPPMGSKTALITGASRGIGRGIAIELARAGARVAINYAGNAEAAAITAIAPAAGDTPAGGEAVALLAKWQDSVFRLWSPTAPATGFVVDARGLIATDRHAVGAAPTIEFQLSPTVKVPARVLVSDQASDAAIVWVDPAVIAGRPRRLAGRNARPGVQCGDGSRDGDGGVPASPQARRGR